jgi:hypothetical protein
MQISWLNATRQPLAKKDVTECKDWSEEHYRRAACVARGVGRSAYLGQPSSRASCGHSMQLAVLLTPAGSVLLASARLEF